MLLNFDLHNWKTIRASKNFTMLAGKEKSHGQRLIKAGECSILPVAAMFGGNASGKSSFVSALAFAKNFVVEGVQPYDEVPVQPFLLDDESSTKPTSMCISFVAENDKAYEFRFKVTREKVVSESLSLVQSGTTQEIYSRNERGIHIASDAPDKERLEMIARCTRPEQLFLTAAVHLNATSLFAAYRWFKYTLTVVEPGSSVALAAYGDEAVLKTVNEVIGQLDLGVGRVLAEEIKRPSMGAVFGAEWGQPIMSEEKGVFTVTTSKGERKTMRILTERTKADGSPVRFDLKNEASGVQQAVGLLPVLLCPQDKVYVVDDLDTHLHPHLAREFLENFLSNCSPKSRSQILLTAHDTQLMDTDLLRREEIWFAERNSDGSSELFSLGDFKDIRKNEDIRKSYLQGRFGGVPRILSGA